MEWQGLLQQLGGWHWLALGMGLLVLEVLLPGVFFVWLAGAALGVGVVLLLFPMFPLVGQVLLFSVLCVVCVLLGRRYVEGLSWGGYGAKEINQGAARLIGTTVTVTVPIEGGAGRVRVGDSEWRAAGPDTPVGKQVMIIATEGNTLIVREAHDLWV